MSAPQKNHYIPEELLRRCGDEHPGGWGDATAGGGGGGGGFHGMDPPPSRGWANHSPAFAPCLRLLVELTCSCAMAGDDPSPLLFPAARRRHRAQPREEGGETNTGKGGVEAWRLFGVRCGFFCCVCVVVCVLWRNWIVPVGCSLRVMRLGLTLWPACV